jgi:DNA primase
MKAGWIDFKAVKERADFVDVLKHYGLKLSRKGEELVGLCPFHADTKPSFRLNLKKGVFHCFGCSAKGNVIDFVSRKEGCTIRRAAELVVDWCGLGTAVLGGREIPAPLEKSPHRGSEAPASHLDAAAVAAEAPRSSQAPGTAFPEAADNGSAPQGEANRVLTFQLKLDPAHPYPLERGLLPKTVERFGLGYSSRGVMKGRIAIPIHDAAGELVAYAGRWPGEPPDGEPKYRLPDGFKKSLALYNLNRLLEAAEGVRIRVPVVLVEGYWSVYRLYELGYAAAALMGHELSAQQEELIAEHAERVIVMMDGGKAGQDGQAQAVSRLARRCYVRSAELPDGAQPDTLREADLMRLLSGS